MGPPSTVRPLPPGLLDAVAPGRLEDFITNAFCWLLSEVPGLGPGFVKFLRDEGCNLPPLVESDLRWVTQTSFWREGKHPVRPDMTCTDGEHGIVFEHKTWSDLSSGQLPKYRKHAPKPFCCSPIVLITAHRGQHQQDPDLALCWSAVYEFLGTWLHQQSGQLAATAEFLVNDFRSLLQLRGLGPMEKLDPEGIRHHFAVRKMNQDLKTMLQSVSARDWPGLNGERDLKVKERWGRLGFQLRGKPWNPGVFVGVLLDGWDHCVMKPSHPELGPDVSVILDLDKHLQVTRGMPPDCARLATELCSPLSGSRWEIYPHALDEAVIHSSYGLHKGPNPWHPLHIRRPVAEVVGDAATGEEQAQRLYEKLRWVVDLVIDNLGAPWTRD